MKTILLITFLVSAQIYADAQELNIIPYPKNVQKIKGYSTIQANAELIADKAEFQPLLSYFNQQLQSFAGKNKGQKQTIKLIKDKKLKLAGEYVLRTDTKPMEISAADNAGFFNGLATLLQIYLTTTPLKNTIQIPKVIIQDQPQFEWRGFMLDESRHFFGVKTVKKLLDWMAFYKLNKFHWHLTDASGWRLEIKKYPLLTSIGGKGNFTDSLASAKYYTQVEIREIVAYASTRNIVVIPEIDMPGHASAANRAYPEFSGGKVSENPDFTFDPAYEETYSYLSDILTEVASLFPGKMVHLGGDEVTLGIDAWRTNPRIKKMMQEKNMKEFTEVEHYFLKRMTDSASKKGLQVICWDEALAASLSPKKTYIQWWRHNKPTSLTEAIDKGYKVILSPRLPLYFDFVQDANHQSGRKWGELYNSYLDLYSYPKDDQHNFKNILGIQANLWTETIASEERLEFLIFPRIASLSESGWTNPRSKNEQDFSKRVKSHLPMYQKLGIYFYNPFEPSINPEKIDFTKKKDIID